MPKIRYEFEGVDAGLSAMFQKFEDTQQRIFKVSQDNVASLQQQIRLMNEYVNTLDARKSFERNMESSSGSTQSTVHAIAGQEKIATELRAVSSAIRDVVEAIHMNAVDTQRNFTASVQNIISGLQDAGGLQISGEVRHRLPSGSERFRGGQHHSRITYEERQQERQDARDRVRASSGGGGGGNRGNGGRGGGWRDGDGSAGYNRISGLIGSSETEASLVAGALAAVPLVGIGLSMLANRAIGEVSQRESAYAAIHGMGGGRLGGFKAFAGMESYGFESPEVMNMYRTTSMGMGFAGSQSTARDLLIAQRAFGLDNNVVGGVAGVSRFTQGNNPMSQISTMITTAISAGMASKDDFARISELLEIQNNIISGEGRVVDSGVIASVMGAVGGAGGVFNTPAMGTALQGINQAFKSPNSPFKQAFTFSVLRQAGVGDDMLDLMLAQEKGIFNEDAPILGNTLQQMLSMSGGNVGRATLNLSRFLDGQVQDPVHTAKTLMDAFARNPEPFMNIKPGQDDISALMKRLGLGATGTLMESKARISETLVDPGIQLAKMGENLQGTFETVSKFVTGGLEFANAALGVLQDIYTLMQRWNGGVPNPVGGMGINTDPNNPNNPANFWKRHWEQGLRITGIANDDD